MCQFRLVLLVMPCMPRISSLESVNDNASPLLFSPTSSLTFVPTPDSPKDQPGERGAPTSPGILSSELELVVEGEAFPSMQYWNFHEPIQEQSASVMVSWDIGVCRLPRQLDASANSVYQGSFLPAQEPGNEARVQCVLYTEFPTSQNFWGWRASIEAL